MTGRAAQLVARWDPNDFEEVDKNSANYVVKIKTKENSENHLEMVEESRRGVSNKFEIRVNDVGTDFLTKAIPGAALRGCMTMIEGRR